MGGSNQQGNNGAVQKFWGGPIRVACDWSHRKSYVTNPKNGLVQHVPIRKVGGIRTPPTCSVAAPKMAVQHAVQHFCTPGCCPACWPACWTALLASIRRQEWSHVFKRYCSHYTCMLASLLASNAGLVWTRFYVTLVGYPRLWTRILLKFARPQQNLYSDKTAVSNAGET